MFQINSNYIEIKLNNFSKGKGTNFRKKKRKLHSFEWKNVASVNLNLTNKE